MAVQAVDTTTGEKTQTPESTQDTTSPSITKQAQNAANDILGAVDKYGTAATKKGQGMVDSVFPPDKRANLVEKIQAFASENPKLSAFLGLNMLLTGIPLLLFILFSISTFIVSLLVALITGLLAAVSFTLLVVGAALLVVLPTVLLTTFTACSIFLWGLVGFYIFRWANGGAAKGSSGSSAVSDKLNRLTNGSLNVANGQVEALDEKAH